MKFYNFLHFKNYNLQYIMFLCPIIFFNQADLNSISCFNVSNTVSTFAIFGWPFIVSIPVKHKVAIQTICLWYKPWHHTPAVWSHSKTDPCCKLVTLQTIDLQQSQPNWVSQYGSSTTWQWSSCIGFNHRWESWDGNPTNYLFTALKDLDYPEMFNLYNTNSQIT